MPALDLNEFQNIVIQVTVGGFVVTAWIQKASDEWGWSTSVFTDSETMTAYVKRVAEALEGPDEKVDLADLNRTKRRGE